MEVLVVSKTKMKDRVCVGGITVKGDFVRLLDINGERPGISSDYEIGQVWEVNYRKPNNPRSLPHSEDVCVISQKYLRPLDRNITMMQFLSHLNVHIYQGHLREIFEEKLKFTQHGKAFINGEDIPQNSVCFWLANRDLIKINNDEKIGYKYLQDYEIPYVGLSKAIDIIPQGTLIRILLLIGGTLKTLSWKIDVICNYLDGMILLRGELKEPYH